jgi:two-component system sensor kinase FixL
MGDPIRLQQAASNLISNAVDAIEKSSQRNLKMSLVRAIPEEIVVSISDTGKGIDPTVKDRLFEPFCTTKKTGLGFGLSICRSIIEEHAGKIWAENNPEAGATFSFSLKTCSGESG